MRSSCLSLQGENLCHYLGMFYDAPGAAFSSASHCSSCSVGAVLQVLELSGCKHTVTLSAAGIAVAWCGVFLQIEYWPLICEQRYPVVISPAVLGSGRLSVLGRETSSVV